MNNSGFAMNDPFILKILGLGDMVALGMMKILPVICIIVVTYAWVKHIVTNDGSFDLTPIFSYIFVVVALVTYKEWMGAIGSFCAVFTGVLGNDAEIYKTLANSVETVKSNKESMDATIWDTMDTWLRELIMWISDGLVIVIRAFLERLRLLALAFVYVAGPYAILLSPLPNFHGAFKKWLNGYLGIQAWAITIRLVDLIVAAYNDTHMDAKMSEDNFIYFTAIQLCFIAMYISVPFLTTMWLVPSAANAFMSKMTGGASMVAGNIIKGGQVAGSAASSTASMGTTAVAYASQAAQSVKSQGVGQTVRNTASNMKERVSKAPRARWDSARENAKRTFS
jgi:hypothetical protein